MLLGVGVEDNVLWDIAAVLLWRTEGGKCSDDAVIPINRFYIRCAVYTGLLRPWHDKHEPLK